MYNGKQKTSKYRFKSIRNTVLLLALILLLCVSVGGTLAYLVRASESLENEFVEAKVVIGIDEDFDGTSGEKTRVQIVNKSNIPVYVRVALVGNWADADGKICIKHDSTQPTFPLGTDWVVSGGYYYYTKAVEVDGSTSNLFGNTDDFDGLTLGVGDDGCTYQLEVIASAIQAQGKKGETLAVNDAWGTSIPALQ